jgi:hypothetical protein
MKRIQIQLTERQEKALRHRASVSDRSLSAVIRDAVDRYVAEDDREGRINRAIAAMRRGFRDRDGARDVAENHDLYLADALEEQIRRGRRRP